MVKNVKQSTSKINCKINNEKKHKRHRLKSILKKPKESTHIIHDQSDQTDYSSYHPVASNLPSLPCVPDCLAEENQAQNENHLYCSSDLDVSPTDRLIDLTVDSDECITIEEDTTNDTTELKNASPKSQEQFQLYPFCTSLKQQCDLTPKNHDISVNKKQFEEDIKVLQDGIQSHINPGRRRRTNSVFYFKAIKRLNNNCYIKQLLQEKNELHKKLKNAKKNLNKKCHLIINKINAIQKVYCTIKELIEFPIRQRKVILSRERWLRSIKKKVLKYDRSLPISVGTKFLLEESIASHQHTRDLDTNKRKVSTDISFLPEVLSENQPEMHDSVDFGNNVFDSEVSSVVQPDINEEKVISDNPSLELRDNELSDAKEKAFMLLEQLKATQDELQKVRKELKSQIDVVNPLVPKLLEIRACLVEKIQCSEILKESFAERITAEQIIFDIGWLTKDKIQCKDDKKCEEVPNTAYSSKVLTVTENEVHLVTLIASFLRTISFSVNLDYIYSYVEKVDNALSRQYIESLLMKYPTFFQEESVSGGTEKKWSYLELKPIITI